VTTERSTRWSNAPRRSPPAPDRWRRTGSRIDATGTGVDWGLVERARQLAGLKGYVTNLPAETMSGQAVIDAYHDMWQVEKSFRVAKSDLRGPADLPPGRHRGHITRTKPTGAGTDETDLI
jgi:hypothetical protein